MKPSRLSALCAPLFVALLFFVTQVQAQQAEFCWSETWGRGVGAIPTSCGAGQQRNGALCYETCRDGYASNGIDLCIQRCPAGASDDGFFCGWASYKAAEYPIWDEGRCRNNHSAVGCSRIGALWVENCRQGYRHVLGFCEVAELNCPAMGFVGNRIANSCTKNVYRRDPVLPSCGAGKQYDAGLCYDACTSGGEGVGPVCWGKGPPGWVQCGAGWAKDKPTCDKTIVEQVMTVVDATVSTALLIGTVGATAAGKSVTSAFSRSVVKEGFKNMAEGVGKETAKQVIKRVAAETAVGTAVTFTADAAISAGNGSIDYIWEVGQIEGSSMTEIEKQHAITQVTLSTLSMFDPTGVVGMVAAYTKPICKDISAMTASSTVGTRSLGAAPATGGTRQPSGALYELFASKALETNLLGLRTQYQQELDAANAQVTTLQNAYNAAPADRRAALQSQLDEARRNQAATRQSLDKSIAAYNNVMSAKTKLASVTAAGPTPPPTGSTATGAGAATTASTGWADASWRATDVGIGANGATWFIGADGASIFRLVNGAPQQVPGAAVRIAVDPAGSPWVVNSTGGIFRWLGTSWQQMPGAARDVGIGADGSVWVLGTDSRPYKWNGTGWTVFPGLAVRIAVGPDGNPWVVNATSQIYRFVNGNWQLLPGAATDIGVGADGTVLVVGTNLGAGGGGIWRYVPANNTWTPEPNLFGQSVAVGPAGRAAVARSAASNLPARVR